MWAMFVKLWLFFILPQTDNVVIRYVQQFVSLERVIATVVRVTDILSTAWQIDTYKYERERYQMVLCSQLRYIHVSPFLLLIRH